MAGPTFFLPVRVLSRLFRRLVLERLAAAHGKGASIFQGSLAKLAPAAAFAALLKPLRWNEVVRLRQGAVRRFFIMRTSHILSKIEHLLSGRL